MKYVLITEYLGYRIYRVQINPVTNPDEFGYMVIEEGKEVNRNNNIFGGIYAPSVEKCVEYIDTI